MTRGVFDEFTKNKTVNYFEWIKEQKGKPSALLHEYLKNASPHKETFDATKIGLEMLTLLDSGIGAASYCGKLSKIKKLSAAEKVANSKKAEKMLNELNKEILGVNLAENSGINSIGKTSKALEDILNTSKVGEGIGEAEKLNEVRKTIENTTNVGNNIAEEAAKVPKVADEVKTSKINNGREVSKGTAKPKWWHPGYVDDLTDSQILLGVKQSPKGLSTLGSATRSEALRAGEAWAGNGAEKIIDKATGELIGFKSTDGMRAFRIQYKPKEGMFRANFQQNEMIRTQHNMNPELGWGKKELSNVHIDILD